VCVPVVLLGPGPLGSSVLLKQPWVLLLRTLLQVRWFCSCCCQPVCLGKYGNYD
jgi:hypothetical protein